MDRRMWRREGGRRLISPLQRVVFSQSKLGFPDSEVRSGVDSRCPLRCGMLRAFQIAYGEKQEHEYFIR